MNGDISRAIERGFLMVLQQLKQEQGQILNFEEQFYTYVFQSDAGDEFVNLAAGADTALATGSLRVSATADFYAVGVCGHSPTQADETAADQPFVFRITSQTDDRLMSNARVHNDNGLGTSERPHFFPRPRKFKANSDVRIDYTNRTGTAIRIYASMIGWNIYKREMSSGVPTRA